MKTLYLVRHAKSSWEHSLQSDFERPLNERGMNAAPLVARRMKEKNVRPALIVTSPANRAQTTAEIFAAILEYPEEKIVQNMAIYTGNTETLLQIMRSLPENCNSAMLFGHNPAMTEFSNFLTGEHLDNIVTCGVMCIDMGEKPWEDAGKGSGKRIWYDYPKKQA
jgi:phosphohistidine phosphatase